MDGVRIQNPLGTRILTKEEFLQELDTEKQRVH